MSTVFVLGLELRVIDETESTSKHIARDCSTEWKTVLAKSTEEDDREPQFVVVKPVIW